MNKYYKIGVGVLVLVLLVGGFILLTSQRATEEVIINNEGVTMNEKKPFNGLKRIDFLRYPTEATMEEIMTRTVQGEVTNTFNRGDLFVAEVLMDEIESGETYSVISRIEDAEGRDLISTGRNFAPLEVAGGGSFSLCCFDLFQSGDFNFILSINENEVANIPFQVQ